jgi:hypothetical protein
MLKIPNAIISCVGELYFSYIVQGVSNSAIPLKTAVLKYASDMTQKPSLRNEDIYSHKICPLIFMSILFMISKI